MPLIGVDARLLTYRRGMGNFVYNMLMELAKLPGDERYILYVDDMQAAEYAPRDLRFVVKKLDPTFYPLWEQVSLPLAVARDRLDLLHCPANTAPLFLPRNVKLTLTVHDVMYALPKSVLPPSPSLYQRLGRMYYRLFAQRAVKRALWVMTVSECSRRDLERLFHLSSDRIRVVYEAGNPTCRRVENRLPVDDVKQRNAIKGRFILALGGLDPRKNTLGVIQSFFGLRRMSALPIQMVIVGLPQAARKRFSKVVLEMGLQEEVILLGFVTDPDLVTLYNGADAFVYPTLYEGFGMPVLEAMACGTPVITSSVGSIPEVAADAALFVDPHQHEEIAGAILRVISDAALRERMIEDGLAQARRFSWANTARQVLDIYRMCATS